MRSLLTSLFALFLVLGCDRSAPPPASTSAEPRGNTAEATASRSTSDDADGARFQAPGRIVALGDVHGDMDALAETLRLSGITDDQGHWVAGDTTLVQTGDILDRGDDEQAIIDYLDRLKNEAREAGGQVVLLNGNHETMNVAGDLRYVTRGGFEDFRDVDGLDLTHPALSRLPEGARARMAALMPGGPYARRLAQRLTVGIVNETVFVHGGVLPHHVEYGIDELNEGVSDWMRGEGEMPTVMAGEDAPVWTRAYSGSNPDCELLDETLEALDAQRMVVGHTVQKRGITSACDEKVWRIDVGMSEHYGGEPAALEIEGENVTVLDHRDAAK